MNRKFYWRLHNRTELDAAALSWPRTRLMLWPGYDHVTMYEGRSSARQPGLLSFYKAITAAAPAEPIYPLHLLPSCCISSYETLTDKHHQLITRHPPPYLPAVTRRAAASPGPAPCKHSSCQNIFK